jgi:hypothetical protein
MKRYVLVLFLFLPFLGYSQNTINNYKYVVVPEKFREMHPLIQHIQKITSNPEIEGDAHTSFFQHIQKITLRHEIDHFLKQRHLRKRTFYRKKTSVVCCIFLW